MVVVMLLCHLMTQWYTVIHSDIQWYTLHNDSVRWHGCRCADRYWCDGTHASDDDYGGDVGHGDDGGGGGADADDHVWSIFLSS